MRRKKTLSNEFLRKYFIGSFSLANFAIKIGKKEIREGSFTNLDSLLDKIETQVKLVSTDEEKKQVGIRTK